MFQTLIKLLTATTFVAHGLLGCCWHHAHPHAVSLEQEVVESGADCHGHQHQHVHHTVSERSPDVAGQPNGSSEVPDESECDEVHCVFIRTQETVNSAWDLPPALVPFLMNALFFDIQGLAESSSQRFAAFSEASLPAAPLLALHQVWLI